MRFPDPPIPGRLVRRYKRFLADVELEDGELVTAHCPNTGSLLGCKEEGAKVWLRDSKDPKRKLQLTWQAIQVKRTWVNVDTNLPNRVVYEALQRDEIPKLSGYAEHKREVPYGKSSRIDVLLTSASGERCYVEVKSTTLTDGKIGLFPDAVTSRGLKHLQELTRVVQNGERAVQFFFISRSDVDTFRPADTIDPAYCDELRKAAKAGVEVMAWSTKVRPKSLVLDRELPIEL